MEHLRTISLIKPNPPPLLLKNTLTNTAPLNRGRYITQVDPGRPDWARRGHVDVPYTAPCVFGIQSSAYPFCHHRIHQNVSGSRSIYLWNFHEGWIVRIEGHGQVARLSAIRSDESIHAARPHGSLNASITFCYKRLFLHYYTTSQNRVDINQVVFLPTFLFSIVA